MAVKFEEIRQTRTKVMGWAACLLKSGCGDPLPYLPVLSLKEEGRGEVRQGGQGREGRGTAGRAG